MAKHKLSPKKLRPTVREWSFIVIVLFSGAVILSFLMDTADTRRKEQEEDRTRESVPHRHGVVKLREREYTLTVHPDAIVMSIRSRGRPLPTAGASGSITLSHAVGPIDLVPARRNRLEARGAFDVQGLNYALAVIRLPDETTDTLPFALE